MRAQVKKKKHPLFLILVIAAIALIILLFLLSYFFLLKTKHCNDEQCFLTALNKCQRCSYETDEWKYLIKAKKDSICVVNVENKFLKDVDADIAERLRGKSMECAIPLTQQPITTLPHEDIDACHGPLKEELLAVMLEKLQEYVIQQIGKFE